MGENIPQTFTRRNFLKSGATAVATGIASLTTTAKAQSEQTPSLESMPDLFAQLTEMEFNVSPEYKSANTIKFPLLLVDFKKYIEQFGVTNTFLNLNLTVGFPVFSENYIFQRDFFGNNQAPNPQTDLIYHSQWFSSNDGKDSPYAIYHSQQNTSSTEELGFGEGIFGIPIVPSMAKFPYEDGETITMPLPWSAICPNLISGHYLQAPANKMIAPDDGKLLVSIQLPLIPELGEEKDGKSLSYQPILHQKIFLENAGELLNRNFAAALTQFDKMEKNNTPSNNFTSQDI